MVKKFLGRFAKKQIILFCAFCVLAAASVLCACAARSMSGRLDSQEASERYRGESDTAFAQVSAFFPAGKGTDMDGVYRLRGSVDGRLADASLEEPENGRLWEDAFSCEGTVAVSSSKISTSSPALGVGGSWFDFHNLRLVSGSYIDETDLMHDRIVIDKTLAWKLFGGYDLEGMTVQLGDKPFIVAGVVERESDFASVKAYSDDGLIIMHFDALDAMTDGNSEISCYELICANPISGFAAGILKEGFPDALIVENSKRFGISEIWNNFRSFGLRSMSDTAVAYPYWENAARLTEDYITVLALLSFLSALFPAFLLVRLAVRQTKRFAAVVRTRALAAWEKASDKIREKQRRRLVEKEEQTYRLDAGEERPGIPEKSEPEDGSVSGEKPDAEKESRDASSGSAETE